MAISFTKDQIDTLFFSSTRPSLEILSFLNDDEIRVIANQNLTLAQFWRRSSLMGVVEVAEQKSLGKGKMGEVFEVKIKDYLQTFAFKYYAGYRDLNHSFNHTSNQYKKCARVPRHPHINACRGMIYNPSSESFGCVFDKIQGTTLDGKALENIHQMPSVERYQYVKNMMLGFAKALQALHAEKIAHNDLGFCNVMITAQGIPYLIDFDDNVVGNSERLIRDRERFAIMFIKTIRWDCHKLWDNYQPSIPWSKVPQAEKEAKKNKLLDEKVPLPVIEMLFDCLDTKKSMDVCSWDRIIRTLEEG